MGLISGMMKVGLVTVAIGGAAALVGTIVLGEERIEDLIHSARGGVNERVDSLMNDRHVLEARVKEVRENYPKDIARLRTQIKDAETAHAEAHREMQTCLAVIDLAKEDIAGLSTALADADGVHRFNERIYTDGEVQALMAKSEQAAEDYRQRYNHLADERDLLDQQITMMKEELKTLQNEWQNFEREYNDIQRQLDQIERNERIIELTKRRTHSRDSARRKQILSLDDARRRIDEVRMQQEEELRVMRGQGPAADYETRAKAKLATLGSEAKATQ